jgi:hypothetical protein
MERREHLARSEPRSLSNEEIEAVSGAGFSPILGGALNCFPIFTEDGHGGIITTSPTLGRLSRPRFGF